jgi:hypothetical protein
VGTVLFICVHLCPICGSFHSRNSRFGTAVQVSGISKSSRASDEMQALSALMIASASPSFFDCDDLLLMPRPREMSSHCSLNVTGAAEM